MSDRGNGEKPTRLTVQNHDRDAAGMTYVYPVVSRRAGGVSVGINLNPNNACNWRCIYCQVPELTRGVAPEIDQDRLETELSTLLSWIVEGDYLERHVAPEQRRLVDIAFSGNGEPTTCKRFDEVMSTVLGVAARYELLGPPPKINMVVISNGSMVGRDEVQRGLQRLGKAGGELWFKVDAGGSAARERVNSVDTPDDVVIKNLVRASGCLRLRIQTCVFALDGDSPNDAWFEGYLGLLTRARDAGASIQDILLYGLARPSLQPEAARLTALDAAELERVAERIRDAGFTVTSHH